MSRSLLFLPDISGFTEFVQTTEVQHSQHVIAELLEVLIAANTQNLELAEIEGDALFFYKEEEIPALEDLMAQVETMFTAFYSHLKLLEKNRICPCNACSSAPKLQLKVIAHSGEIQFINVQGKRKPFGTQVIEVHRLMKNSVDSDNYVLLSQSLVDDIGLAEDYQSPLFNFQKGENRYDGKIVHYQYAVVDKNTLKLSPFSQAKKLDYKDPPSLSLSKEYPISASQLLEYITNYAYRHHWVEGVDKYEFNQNEVTRAGSEHVCVINGRQLNFITVTKDCEPNQLVYGELSTSPPPVDELCQFFLITPLTENSSRLETDIYLKAKSPIKKLILFLFLKNFFRKNIRAALENLLQFVQSNELEPSN